ncbi:MAG: SPFH domain-containing protein, partial [Cyclobacteriaceae bacterium]|nr:SPFH domain-containing protein [Cyclobacteriaceae bacterium]
MEKSTKPLSGYLMVLVAIALIPAIVFAMINQIFWLGIMLIVSFILILPGFFTLQPNKAMVLILFGAYKGTVKDNGFF